jgi:hypothetical protein
MWFLRLVYTRIIGFISDFCTLQRTCSISIPNSCLILSTASAVWTVSPKWKCLPTVVTLYFYHPPPPKKKLCYWVVTSLTRFAAPLIHLRYEAINHGETLQYLIKDYEKLWDVTLHNAQFLTAWVTASIRCWVHCSYHVCTDLHIIIANPCWWTIRIQPHHKQRSFIMKTVLIKLRLKQGITAYHCKMVNKTIPAFCKPLPNTISHNC